MGLTRCKRWTYDASRWIARLVGVLAFAIRVHGRENVAPGGAMLVCSNHQSVLDPVVVGLAFDRRLNYLARESLFRSPVFAGLIRWYDAIPIQRDGFGLAGIKETLRRLRKNEAVLVFPEGTRTLDGQLGPLKPGICSLARRGHATLVPVAVDGAFQAWPRKTRWPRREQLVVVIGKPIRPDEFEQLDDTALITLLGQRMNHCLRRAQADRSRHQT